MTLCAWGIIQYIATNILQAQKLGKAKSGWRKVEPESALVSRKG
jgi:hypothetical protein